MQRTAIRGCDKTPKEQYYLHADSRDEGLRDIDADDPNAFHEWLHDRTRHGDTLGRCAGEVIPRISHKVL